MTMGKNLNWAHARLQKAWLDVNAKIRDAVFALRFGSMTVYADVVSYSVFDGGFWAVTWPYALVLDASGGVQRCVVVRPRKEVFVSCGDALPGTSYPGVRVLSFRMGRLARPLAPFYACTDCNGLSWNGVPLSCAICGAGPGHFVRPRARTLREVITAVPAGSSSGHVIA